MTDAYSHTINEQDWASRSYLAYLAATPPKSTEVCNWQFNVTLPTAVEDRRKQTQMAALLPIALGWLVVHVVVWVVRWARRGFTAA